MYIIVINGYFLKPTIIEIVEKVLMDTQNINFKKLRMDIGLQRTEFLSILKIKLLKYNIIMKYYK